MLFNRIRSTPFIIIYKYRFVLTSRISGRKKVSAELKKSYTATSRQYNNNIIFMSAKLIVLSVFIGISTRGYRYAIVKCA